MVERGRSIVTALDAAQVTARLFGGIAIALRCESARRPPLAREYGDLDLVVARGSVRGGLGAVLKEHGYAASERFNALHGHSRLLFDGSPDGTHVDVFVDRFAMCHSLDLSSRLALGDLTLPLGDLLLTKLQVAELNRKDLSDAAALLVDHDLTDDERGINVRYCAALLAADWGWWRTVTENLDRMAALGPLLELSGDAAQRLGQQVADLRSAIEQHRKTVRWKARARVGDRLAWRDEPEEIAHAT